MTLFIAVHYTPAAVVDAVGMAAVSLAAPHGISLCPDKLDAT
jgi:hypothetical protein